MSDIIDINVAQAIEEVTINATPNLIEVNINNMNAGKHSDLVLDDGTNPHGTTKTDVGLSNVPNLDTTNAVNLAHTHSNFSALNALSGANTGDETTLSIQIKRPLKTVNSTSLEGSGNIEINVDFSTHDLEELQNVTSTNYTTPIDTDSLLTFDITNSLWKRLSWSNIKSNLKTYFDGIYTTTSAVATQITTALSGYATQAWVTSQGYITNVITALGFTPENVANKSTSTSLGTSDTLYPTQNAVKTYADTKLEKITTSDVEKVYIKNADGTQGMKATSDLRIDKLTIAPPSIVLTNVNTWYAAGNTGSLLSSAWSAAFGTGTTPSTILSNLYDSGRLYLIDVKNINKIVIANAQSNVFQHEFFIQVNQHTGTGTWDTGIVNPQTFSQLYTTQSTIIMPNFADFTNPISLYIFIRRISGIQTSMSRPIITIDFKI